MTVNMGFEMSRVNGILRNVGFTGSVPVSSVNT